MVDLVKAFNSELASLYEAKPPISKAKMVQVTKGAMKALKWYKHVVLSVEKFIIRCKPEYKIPGLYVIDSICRQSRHQFGQEKDVFAPRFAKNLLATIELLFNNEADVPKVLRVINLWRQNAVFDAEHLKPIFELAESKGYDIQSVAVKKSTANGERQSQHTNSHEKQRHERRKTPPKEPSPAPELRSTPAADNPAFLQSIQELTTTLITNAKQKPQGIKKLLAADYEYSDESGDEGPKSQDTSRQHMEKSAAAAADLLSNPSILQQIQKMQAEREHRQPQQPVKPVAAPVNPVPVPVSHPVPVTTVHQQAPAMGQHVSQPLPNVQQALGFPPPGFNPGFAPPAPAMSMPVNLPPANLPPANLQPPGNIPFPPPGFGVPPPNFQMNRPPAFGGHMPNPQMLGIPLVQPPDAPLLMSDQDERRERRERKAEREPTTVYDERLKRKKRSRSRSKSRDHKKHKHRDRDDRAADRDERAGDRDDRSRDRDDRRHRKRMRKDEREEREGRSHSREKKDKDKEKDKERKKQGLPIIRPNMVAVCSRTLWFGRVSQNCTEPEINEAIKDYGDTEKIDFVPPRGCAYVTMQERKSAYKILDKLQRDLFIAKKQIKLAWAPNRGVKTDEYKDMWDGDKGVTYIPFHQLPADLTPLLDGGVLDVESLPESLKDQYDCKGKLTKAEEVSGTESGAVSAAEPVISQPSTSQHIPTLPMPPQFAGLPPGFPFGPGMLPGRLPMPPGMFQFSAMNSANIPLPSEQPKTPVNPVVNPVLPPPPPQPEQHRRSRWEPEAPPAPVNVNVPAPGQPGPGPPPNFLNNFQSPPPNMNMPMNMPPPLMNMNMNRFPSPPQMNMRGGGRFPFRGGRGGPDGFRGRGRGRGNWEPRGRNRDNFDNRDNRWQERDRERDHGGHRDWHRERERNERNFERHDRFDRNGSDLRFDRRDDREEPAAPVDDNPESQAMAAFGLPTGFGCEDKESLNWFSSVANKPDSEQRLPGGEDQGPPAEGGSQHEEGGNHLAEEGNPPEVGGNPPPEEGGNQPPEEGAADKEPPPPGQEEWE